MATPSHSESKQRGVDLGGDQEALDHLLPLVYQELREIARRQLNRERSGHTLDSVALVNEAYLKLVEQDDVQWQNRAHFFAVAARAMRTILVDYARMHKAAKRGGGVPALSLNRPVPGTTCHDLDHLLALDEALQRLAQVNEDASRIIELRFFGGLTHEESAAVLNVSSATVRRRWSFGKAWLQRELA